MVHRKGEHVDSHSVDSFVISYLLLQIISLNLDIDFKLMTVIPELPDSYTSDPRLKPFLKLLIEGLSENPSIRPSIDTFQRHNFLHEEAVINTGYDEEEREFLEIAESVVSSNVFKRERVKSEANARRGFFGLQK